MAQLRALGSVWVNISVALFPLLLIRRVICRLQRTMQIRITKTDADEVTLRILANQDHCEQLIPILCEELTREGMAYWSQQKWQQPVNWLVTIPFEAHLTIKVRAEAERPPQILLAAHPGVHDPRQILAALAPLREEARIIITSLKPVDQVLLTAEPAPGIDLATFASTLLRLLMASNSRYPQMYRPAKDTN